MSLLSSASPWITETTPKKRIPTMGKTVKKQDLEQPSSSSSYTPSSSGEYSNFQPEDSPAPSWTDDESHTEQRNARVNHLIEHMASISGENDGMGLADFKPLSHPHVPDSSYLPVLPVPAFRNSGGEMSNPGTPNPMPSSSGPTVGDYRQIYEPPRRSLPSLQVDHGSQQDKILTKINYLIHMMEERANEKTHNATEEFIMFTLVGVFIIYVLDSFSRTGKYVR